MIIKEEKKDELKKRMKKLNIEEKDITEKFILGSGPGGQKIQKTHSCVYLKHIPTNIEIKCQRDRSRDANRFLARRELCDRIEANILRIETEKKKLEDKIRKQKKRRSRRLKRKLIEEKRHLSEKKLLRKPPSIENSK